MKKKKLPIQIEMFDLINAFNECREEEDIQFSIVRSFSTSVVLNIL